MLKEENEMELTLEVEMSSETDPRLFGSSQSISEFLSLLFQYVSLLPTDLYNS